VRPFAAAGIYVNYLGDDEPGDSEMVRSRGVE
jgi:hypothetical protein